MEEYGTLHAEPIKIGKYKGHKYFVNMNQFLCLNGYAEIPEKLKEGEEDYIDVHGGVTFKGYLINGEEKSKSNWLWHNALKEIVQPIGIYVELKRNASIW